MSPQFLSGSFDHSLDDKFRVIIPAAYRPALGNLFYLTKSLIAEDRHLSLYPEAHYEELVDKLEKRINPKDRAGQWRLRDFYRHAIVVEMDTQGRITIPPLHRECAGLRKRVVFVGRRSHAELWDAEVFEGGQRETQGDLADYLGD